MSQRVFISSTGKDLSEYREAAIKVCISLDLHPEAMEFWENMGRGATAISLAKLDQAHVYVGIFAHRYGFVEPDGDPRSVTEREFDHAAGRLDRLCFLLSDKHPWPMDLIEKKQLPLQDAFKERVQLTAALEFTTVENFKYLLHQALSAWKTRQAGRPSAPGPQQLPSSPGNRPGHGAVQQSEDVERLWREKGPEAALRAMEQRLDEAAEESVVAWARLLRQKAEPASLPLLCRLLTHRAGAVSKRALAAIHKMGWETVRRSVDELVREGRWDRVAWVLEGLPAFEAGPDLMALLEHLVVILKEARLRERANFLLERKSLARDLEKLAAVFRENKKPLRLQRALGQGLLTGAYLAYHEKMEMQVVVRVLRTELAIQPLLRARFLELCSRSARLNHQNLLRTLDMDSLPERNLFYSIRDYVEGVTLKDALDGGRTFEPVEGINILRRTSEALAPFHEQGWLHGGVKPSNLFLCRQNRVVLGDPSFTVEGVGLVLDQRLNYDYKYAAPEMCGAEGELGPAADLYSLGCVAYELFFGRPPFVSPCYKRLSIQQATETIVLPPGPDQSLGATGDDLLRRLLAKQPRDRFASVAELAEALDAFAAQLRGGRLPSTSLSQYQPLQTLNSGDSEFELSLDSTPETAKPTPKPPSGGQPRQLPAVIGPYQVSRELGRGAFGVVYEGFDPRLDRNVAIKVLNRAALHSAKALERFLREARVVAHMHHNHIVPVYELGEHEGSPYIASRFIPGKTLADLIPEEGMKPPKAVGLVLQLLDGLAYAHQLKVLHRDVKPANVIVDEEGQLYLTDFGLAGWVGQTDGLTHEGTVLGTPSHMAPEQARGDIHQVNEAADQYSAGVVLYELLTGRLPFEGVPFYVLIHHVIETPPRPPSSFRPDLDPQLESLCLRALAKKPEERFPSCREFAEALRTWLARYGSPGPIPGAALVESAGGEPVAATFSRGHKETTVKPTTARQAAPVPKDSQQRTGGQGRRNARPLPVCPEVARQEEEASKPGTSRRTWLLSSLAVLTLLGAGGYLVSWLARLGSGNPSKGPVRRGLSKAREGSQENGN